MDRVKINILLSNFPCIRIFYCRRLPDLDESKVQNEHVSSLLTTDCIFLFVDCKETFRFQMIYVFHDLISQSLTSHFLWISRPIQFLELGGKNDGRGEGQKLRICFERRKGPGIVFSPSPGHMEGAINKTLHSRVDM